MALHGPHHSAKQSTRTLGSFLMMELNSSILNTLRVSPFLSHPSSCNHQLLDFPAPVTRLYDHTEENVRLYIVHNPPRRGRMERPGGLLERCGGGGGARTGSERAEGQHLGWMRHGTSRRFGIFDFVSDEVEDVQLSSCDALCLESVG
jgi:hypothetical protein